MSALTFSELRKANDTRQMEWPGNEQADIAFRAVEVAGEFGEVCEAIKKFLRAERGIAGSTAKAWDVADEMADALIALDLLASAMGIDLGEAVRTKFNFTSDKYGMRTSLPKAADGILAPGKWTPRLDGLPPDCPVVPLGTANGVYFFRDTIGQFRALKACEFGQREITSLFHGRAQYLYWAWPRQNAMNQVTTWRAEKAAETLMAACAFKGIWKATGPDAPAGGTCADEARSTEALFKIGDQVRLKSERRFMTIAMLDCVDVTCQWFDGASLEEADFHRDMLTAEPYPDHVPF